MSPSIDKRRGKAYAGRIKLKVLDGGTYLSVKIGEAVIACGKFIQTVVDFLIVAICIFAVVRLFERFKKKEEKTEAPPAKSADVVLLEEIRDILKNKN